MIELPKAESLWGGALTVVGGGALAMIGKWLARKERREREASRAQATIEVKNIEFAQAMIETYREDLELLKKEMAILKKEAASCDSKYRALLSENASVKKELESIKRRLTKQENGGGAHPHHVD